MPGGATSSRYLSSERASFGRFSWVMTSSTPSTASASRASIRRMRPRAIAEVMTKPCTRPARLYSAAYFAVPVTLTRPSTREVGTPI